MNNVSVDVIVGLPLGLLLVWLGWLAGRANGRYERKRDAHEEQMQRVQGEIARGRRREL